MLLRRQGRGRRASHGWRVQGSTATVSQTARSSGSWLTAASHCALMTSSCH